MALGGRFAVIRPAPERRLENLPVALRGLADYVLTGEATTYDVAYALASIIDVVEHVQREPEQPDTTRH